MALMSGCVMTKPSSSEEAVQQSIWVDAMVEDYDSIVRNSVWDVVLRPEDKFVVRSGWLYKVKKVVDGSVEKHKARFVVRRFSQVEWTDYDETFTPISRINNYFTRLGFTKIEADANLYHIVVEGKMLIIAPYVDDLILTDWAGSPSNGKITLGGIFSIGSATISWYNKKQRLAALSSVEVEYMVASQAACEAIWMRKIMVGIFGPQMDPTMIYCDNKSCIKLSKNLVFHDRSKHIDIRHHHIRDCVLRWIMLLEYIPTEEKDVDILTKELSRCKFKFHKDRIGVADNPFLVERECS
eukprot:PITA_31823